MPQNWSNLTDWATLMPLILTNFSLAMLILAVIFILFHSLIRFKYVSFYEITYRWIALFALGFTGIYTFIMHAFYPDIAAAAIGWATSPFQYEVAMSDLAIGLLGIFSFKASQGFRLATVFAGAVCLWGDAAGHLYQMMVNNDFSPGNTGSWFWTDLIIPLVLVVCLQRLSKQS